MKKEEKIIYHSIKGEYKGELRIISIGMDYEVDRPLTIINIVQIFLKVCGDKKYDCGDKRYWKFSHGDIRLTEKNKKEIEGVVVLDIKYSKI